MQPDEAAALGTFLNRWLATTAAQSLPRMNHYELSSCLHALAGVGCRRSQAALPWRPPRAWMAAWMAAAEPHLRARAFHPKRLTLALWALSRLAPAAAGPHAGDRGAGGEWLPPGLLRQLLAAAGPQLHRFNAQDMSLTALALSTFAGAEALRLAHSGSAAAAAGGPAAPLHELVDDRWRRRFLSRASRLAADAVAGAGGLEARPTAPDARLGPQALANLLHGLVRSGLMHGADEAVAAGLLRDLTAALGPVLAQLPAQGLANVLSALAAAAHAPEPRWLEAFLRESVGRMAVEGPRHEAAGGEPGSEEGEGLGARGRRAGRGEPGRLCGCEDLAHLAAAAAGLGVAPPRWWMERLHAAAERALPSATPRQLAALLHALARLHRAAAAPGGPGGGGAGWWPRSLVAAWLRAAAPALPAFNATDAAHSLWALASLRERPPSAWLQRLLVGLRGAGEAGEAGGLRSAGPHDLALLLWSLSALGFQPTWSWLADAAEAARPALARMDGQVRLPVPGMCGARAGLHGCGRCCVGHGRWAEPGCVSAAERVRGSATSYRPGLRVT